MIWLFIGIPYHPPLEIERLSCARVSRFPQSRNIIIMIIIAAECVCNGRSTAQQVLTTIEEIRFNLISARRLLFFFYGLLQAQLSIVPIDPRHVSYRLFIGLPSGILLAAFHSSASFSTVLCDRRIRPIDQWHRLITTRHRGSAAVCYTSI